MGTYMIHPLPPCNAQAMSSGFHNYIFVEWPLNVIYQNVTISEFG